MNNDYNFPVEMQPIFLQDGKQIANRQAVVRTDTMESLGIVSHAYGLVKHSTVIDSLREAGKEYGVKEKISLVNNGANLFYEMQFPKVQAEVSKGDILRLVMIAKNSYNGANTLQMIFGALRLVCLNGMVIGTNFMQFNFRHIGNVRGLADMNPIEGEIIEQYSDTYKNYVKQFVGKVPEMTAMTKASIPNNTDLFDPESTKMPKYLLEEAQASFEQQNGNTVWDYYNSLTYAITHKSKSENPGNAIYYGTKAWDLAEKLLG